MRKLTAILTVTAAMCFPVSAAFEPVSLSPWLQGGVASSLFPRSPLALGHNPSSLALLEGPGLAVSASRPFGLKRLDRTAVAGNIPGGAWAVGGMLSVSGDDSYTEISADAALAWRLVPRVAAGLGLSLNRLQISGYGRATGGALHCSAVWSPVDGVYATALIRSLVRTGLGSSGDPASPRSVEMALGAVPAENVVISLGAAGQEGVNMEYSVHTAFSPVDMLALCTGIRTGPTRFWASVQLSVPFLEVQYGYGEHSSLPGTHSISLSHGDSGFRPRAMNASPQEEVEAAVEFPLNVNTATEEQLTEIPGIGPAKASAITSWIRTNGPVSSVLQLEAVPGIGPSMIQVLAEYLTAE